jgi:hypothetical protein
LHTAQFPSTPTLTIRLLVPGTGTRAAKLLGLAPTVVGHEKGAVEGDEGLLERVLGVLVNELLVVGDERLGDGLPDGVDLRGMATTRHSDADVNCKSCSSKPLPHNEQGKKTAALEDEVCQAGDVSELQLASLVFAPSIPRLPK